VRAGICLRVGLPLQVFQVVSEDKMATDLQMVTLLFYHNPTCTPKGDWLNKWLSPFKEVLWPGTGDSRL
jgi:hypothetical protein